MIKYWLAGGIIGLVIAVAGYFTLLFFIVAALLCGFTNHDGLFQNTFICPQVTDTGPLSLIFIHIIYLAVAFALGTLLGLSYGKVKGK